MVLVQVQQSTGGYQHSSNSYRLHWCGPLGCSPGGSNNQYNKRESNFFLLLLPWRSGKNQSGGNGEDRDVDAMDKKGKKAIEKAYHLRKKQEKHADQAQHKQWLEKMASFSEDMPFDNIYGDNGEEQHDAAGLEGEHDDAGLEEQHDDDDAAMEEKQDAADMEEQLDAAAATGMEEHEYDADVEEQLGDTGVEELDEDKGVEEHGEDEGVEEVEEQQLNAQGLPAQP